MAPMKLKSSCCKKYRRKARACTKCPLIAVLSKRKRHKKLRKIKKRLARAA